jgi:hypothetical protein
MKNPYLVALRWITSGVAFVCFVMAGTGLTSKDAYGQPDPGDAGLLTAALTLLGVGFLSLLFTLLLGGIQWVVLQSRAARQPLGTARDSIRDAD